MWPTRSERTEISASPAEQTRAGMRAIFPLGLRNLGSLFPSILALPWSTDTSFHANRPGERDPPRADDTLVDPISANRYSKIGVRRFHHKHVEYKLPDARGAI